MTDIMYFSWNVYVYIFIDYIDYMYTDFILFSVNDVFNVYLSISHTPSVYTNSAFQLQSIILLNISISLCDNSLSTNRQLKEPFSSFASEETPALPLVSADSTKTKGQDENKTSELVAPKDKEKKDSKDEIQIEVTAKLGGIDVTVTSVEGDLTHVIIGGEEFFTCLLIQCC